LHLADDAGNPTYRKQALWIGEVEDGPEGKAFAQLALLMNRFGVHLAAIDALPETRMAREFQTRFWGRVFLIHLSGTQKDALKIDWDQQEATAGRTVSMDATVELFRRQMNYLPQDLPDGYVSHLTANIRRVLVKEGTNEQRVVWEPTRPDDYAMAELFDMLANELWWAKTQVEAGSQETLTPLDEMVEFQRSGVTDLTDDEWRPGPGGTGLGGFVEESAQELGLVPPDYGWLDEE
jgi:hypothetical protein